MRNRTLWGGISPLAFLAFRMQATKLMGHSSEHEKNWEKSQKKTTLLREIASYQEKSFAIFLEIV